MAENHEHTDGHDINYKKIYFMLVGLLIISVIGPFFGVVWVTLITAFGIALVKASLVIRNFMHLKWEKRVMKWMLTTSLILMALMMAGVSPDVLNHEGNNWQNRAAQAAVERGLAAPGEGEGAETEEPTEVAGFSAQSTFSIVCASCHGSAGDGTGPAGLALNPPPANFTDPTFWETRDRDRIVNVITNGAAAAFGGSSMMVAWSASYDDEQIQELADYVINRFRPNE